MDPELQAGTVTHDQALAVQTNYVVCSPAFARSEVERYSLRAPGRPTAKFNALRFHDFILVQGLLPPDVIREAVMNDFVASQR